ncbi:hypothetical protein [Nocardia sp. NPDC057440]|uniref:hypothetical protein n=1 Tax=Nocardia sp. NPDC057440 TaxID=3346134 RepID=UPI00366E75EE
MIGKKWFHRIGVAILVMSAVALTKPQLAHADSAPPCRNYEVQTEWGRLTVDTRPSNDGDPIGVVSWAWFINNPADVPGRYDWTVFINSRAPEGPQWNNKDDNLHSAFRRYRDGTDRYNSGDIFHVEAAHQAGNNLYVTPLNSCRIP